MATSKQPAHRVVVIPPDVHREAKVEAARRGMTLGEYVAALLRKTLGMKAA